MTTDNGWDLDTDTASPEPQGAPRAGDDGREARAAEFVDKRRVTLVTITNLKKGDHLS